MTDSVTLQIGIPERFRQRAAALYYAAFEQKFTPIFRDPVRGAAVLAVSLDLHHAVAAIRADELVGVAGFKHAGNGLVGVQYEAMRQAFGWIGGLWRVLALSIFSRRETPGELLMDGIVVDNSLRGQGIGSQLLDAVVAFAAERGYRRVRLDVVDTNPRARQLYERKGFVATQTASYPYLRAIFNFGSATTLVKTLE